LSFKGLEFDTFKNRVVNLLPDADEFEGDAGLMFLPRRADKGWRRSSVLSASTEIFSRPAFPSGG
jgi:hypothetical protein